MTLQTAEDQDSWVGIARTLHCVCTRRQGLAAYHERMTYRHRDRVLNLAFRDHARYSDTKQCNQNTQALLLHHFSLNVFWSLWLPMTAASSLFFRSDVLYAIMLGTHDGGLTPISPRGYGNRGKEFVSVWVFGPRFALHVADKLSPAVRDEGCPSYDSGTNFSGKRTHGEFSPLLPR